MSNGMKPQKGIIVPEHLQKEYDKRIADQVEKEASIEEDKAHADFDAFCEEHNVKFMPFIDLRVIGGRINQIGDGLAFISNKRVNGS